MLRSPVRAAIAATIAVQPQFETAADFIASYEEHGDELPPTMAAAGELVIAV
ncbi:hypothetical protein [Candidatus Poriferisodalis sp.]|uniref:hypothetical protein n=1 Tax=Candidatus Poriferisodalis sp. TaxID=3101277 RepID=UPI003B01317D